MSTTKKRTPLPMLPLRGRKLAVRHQVEEPLTAAEKKKLGSGPPPSAKKSPTAKAISKAFAKGVPLVRGVPVPQTTSAQARKVPSAEDLARIAKARQSSVTALLDTATYVPLEFAPDYRPRHQDDKRTCVCINAHRNTCIRVSVGRTKVTYIPLLPEGIMVKHAGIDSFNAEWRLTLSDEHPATAARQYLMSFQALHHISEEARTLLEGISKQGANFKPTKENDMTASTTTATSTSKKKGFDKKTAAAAYKAAVTGGTPKISSKAVAPSAKKAKPTKAAPSKAASKASKPATKGAKAKAAKPAARGQYAGKSISKATTYKAAMDSIREGTFRKALMAHIATFKTTDDAIGSAFDFNKEERVVATIDIKVAETLGVIKVA